MNDWAKAFSHIAMGLGQLAFGGSANGEKDQEDRPKRRRRPRVEDPNAFTPSGFSGGRAGSRSRGVGGKCPLCGARATSTEMAVGPVFVRVCEPCSQPVWHIMGLVNWIAGR